MVHNQGDLDAWLQQLRRVYPDEIIGCQGVRRTRTLCSALQSAMPHHGRLLSTGGSCLCEATALDTVVDMLNPQPTAGALLMYGLLFRHQFLATWFLCRHEDLYLGKHGCRKPRFCHSPLPAGTGYGVANISVSLLVFTPRHESQQIHRTHQLH
jgi:hypothetical protein